MNAPVYYCMQPASHNYRNQSFVACAKSDPLYALCLFWSQKVHRSITKHTEKMFCHNNGCF